MSDYLKIKNNWREYLSTILEALNKSDTVLGASRLLKEKANLVITSKELVNLFERINDEIGQTALQTPGKYLGESKKINRQDFKAIINLEKKIDEKLIDFSPKEIDFSDETFAVSEYIRKKGISDVIILANHFQKSPRQIENIINDAIKRGFKIGKMTHGKAYWEEAVKLPWGESRIIEIDPIKDHIKVIALGDTHIGSKHWFMKENIDFINYGWERGCQIGFHSGDIVDGIGVYRGQIAEVAEPLIKDQVQTMVDKFPYKKDFKWYFVTGNHDLSTYKTNGYDPGETIVNRRNDFEYLGMMRARVKIMDKQIELFHGGSPAYSLSYPIEKHIRATTSGSKPHVLLMGHLHSAVYLPLHRNIHCFMVGCFQGETLWTIAKSLPATTGGWILDFGIDKKGFIKSMKSEWVGYYQGVRVEGWEKE